MVKTVIKFVPTLVSILFWVGLQVSGIVIPWLGYSLMGLAVILLLIPGWPYIRRIHFQWPITLQQRIKAPDIEKSRDTISLPLEMHSSDLNRVVSWKWWKKESAYPTL